MTPVQDVLETKIESTIAGMVMGDSEEGGTNKEDQIRSALKAAGVDEDRLNELGITVEDIANGSISKNDLAEMGISRNILDGINQQSADNGTEPLENIEIPRDMQISAIENGKREPSLPVSRVSRKLSRMAFFHACELTRIRGTPP